MSKNANPIKNQKKIVDDKSFVSYYESRPIDKNAKTYVVIHGFQNTINEPWIKDMQAALAKKDPTANIVALEWPSDISTLDYILAADRTKYAGEYLANWIKSNSLEPANVVLIGHSLGAHVAGYTGEAIKQNVLKQIKQTRDVDSAAVLGFAPNLDQMIPAGKLIGEIVALDPAGPMFTNGGGLTVTAAKKVIAFHTNPAGFGTPRPVGHLDFYVNDSIYQPNTEVYNPFGNHSYATEFFTDLLQGTVFKQKDAPSLGLDSIRSMDVNGSMNLYTNLGKEPIGSTNSDEEPISDDRKHFFGRERIGIAISNGRSGNPISGKPQAKRSGLVEDNQVGFSHDQGVNDLSSQADDKLIGNFSVDHFSNMQSMAGADHASLTHDNVINFANNQPLSNSDSAVRPYPFDNAAELSGSGFVKNAMSENLAPVSSETQLILGSNTQSQSALAGLGNGVNAQNHNDLLISSTRILWHPTQEPPV